jgi:hypothetical protein
MCATNHIEYIDPNFERFRCRTLVPVFTAAQYKKITLYKLRDSQFQLKNIPVDFVEKFIEVTHGTSWRRSLAALNGANKRRMIEVRDQGAGELRDFREEKTVEFWDGQLELMKKEFDGVSSSSASMGSAQFGQLVSSRESSCGDDMEISDSQSARCLDLSLILSLPLSSSFSCLSLSLSASPFSLSFCLQVSALWLCSVFVDLHHSHVFSDDDLISIADTTSNFEPDGYVFAMVCRVRKNSGLYASSA